MEIRTAAPRIPDHEVLRCIGKGSYGEVWLARAVTGTLRAVKVVRREDFELDRTFEREFEGIMKFEPVSREHPGLVHVLHVGRNDEEKFYYYVMELGDDRERGSRVDAADYEPRTMGTDRAMKHRLPVSEVIEHGAQVAEGLAHLHECGLTHRDIKPSNIIFVNGKAKLADIGLVAAAGQMTFVGTEGFVPPEGPGTKLADIYSLGMVLYEVSTGKDRLQFPDLPDEMVDARSRPQWQALNELILKACAPQPRKRVQTAREMASALRAAGRRKPKGAPWVGRLVALPFVTCAAAFVLVTWQHNGAMPWPPGRFTGKDGIAPPPPAREGEVVIESEPVGVEVWFNGKLAGRTPMVASVPEGDAQFLLRRKRYRDTLLPVPGIAAGERRNPGLQVMRYDYPRPGQPWENSIGILFDPTEYGHISKRAVTFDQIEQVHHVEEGSVINEETAPGETHYLMAIPVASALQFCEILTQREKSQEWLTADMVYIPQPYTPKGFNQAQPLKNGAICFRLVIAKYGTVLLDSEPRGAMVYSGERSYGPTPCAPILQTPGDYEFRLVLPGYMDRIVKGTLESGGKLEIVEELEKSKLAVFGKTWTNRTGLTFEPLDSGILVATTEVRVRDYAAFAKATGRRLKPIEGRKNPAPGANQEEDHPVVHVSRSDAKAYCEWLTLQDRSAQYLDSTMEYRLPWDAEWSLAAGSPNLTESRRTPAERHLALGGVYPWVPPYQFPPPGGSSTARAAGNLGDLSALRAGSLPGLKPPQIAELEALGYDDGMPWTSPAGRFAPNGIGLYDLSGNVWEFVGDDYGSAETTGTSNYAVVRGGAWNTPAASREELATQFRKAIAPDSSDASIGFRLVLAPLLPAPVLAPSNPAPPAATPPPLPGSNIAPSSGMPTFPADPEPEDSDPMPPLLPASRN